MWWISEGSKFHWSTVSEAAQAKGFCSKYLYLTITWGIWSIPVSTEERSCWEGVYTVSRSEVGMRTLVREEILTDHWHFVVYSGFDQLGGGATLKKEAKSVGKCQNCCIWWSQSVCYRFLLAIMSEETGAIVVRKDVMEKFHSIMAETKLEANELMEHFFGLYHWWVVWCEYNFWLPWRNESQCKLMRIEILLPNHVTRPALHSLLQILSLNFSLKVCAEWGKPVC